MPGGTILLNPSYGPAVRAIVAQAPDRDGGGGGWQPSARAGRAPGKWFKAVPDDTYNWTLILDADATPGTPIENRVRNIRNMGQPGSGHSRPPSIELSGDVLDADARIRWVMDSMSLGDRLYVRGDDGEKLLIRQVVTVGLSRYVELDEIETVRITTTRKRGKRRKRLIKTKANDTLRAVALRELGSGSRWKDLVKWNKKKLAKVNPDARLRTGTHLYVY